MIDFADGKYPVDVVPAMYKGPSAQYNNYPVYYIPDSQGGWMETSPQSHNKFINDADIRSGGKLKNIAKVLKYWRICRSPSTPLNSFHVELLLASEKTCEGVKSYSSCMYSALKLILEREGRALQDPLGISGLINAANTEAKRIKVSEAADTSFAHAVRAIIEENSGLLPEACRQWDLVFNGYFPKS